jgi:hypothetical protein
MKTRTIRVRGIECESAHEAVTIVENFAGDHAISLCGRFFVVRDDEFERLQRLGVQPTTWHHHHPTGRLLSVPGDV